jgi:flagellar motility protein MotE (MotC chaperone)
MIMEIVKIIFALGAFLLLTCLVIKWALRGIIDNLLGYTVEKAKLEINDLKEHALKEISNMLSDQKKSFEDFPEQRKIELTQAMEAANEDLNQRIKLIETALEAQLRDLEEEYEGINNELRKWEASQNLRRSDQAAESMDYLVKYLDNLKINGAKIPEPTIELYRKRHRLFESLERFSQIDNNSAPRLSNVDFSLPSAPKLPLPASTASDGLD